MQIEMNRESIERIKEQVELIGMEESQMQIEQIYEEERGKEQINVKMGSLMEGLQSVMMLDMKIEQDEVFEVVMAKVRGGES